MSSCLKLQTLNLSGLDLSQIPASDMKTNIQKISALPELKSLDLGKTKMELTPEMVEFISNNKSLQNLNLKGIKDSPSHSEQMSTLLFRKNLINRPLHNMQVNNIQQSQQFFAKEIRMIQMEEEKGQADSEGYTLEIEDCKGPQGDITSKIF
mmetsp:Transcript_23300/g.17730  ORF Transcript_23300/g.17730 Transcript_23300/m.17730 type:complete len:152 (-) Transcript_23300:930-1385(-)